jgi:hypothetical protein
MWTNNKQQQACQFMLTCSPLIQRKASSHVHSALHCSAGLLTPI